MDATGEVSLADVSLASVTSVGSPLDAMDLTEDVSLHDLSLVPSAVANDSEQASSQELHHASSDAALLVTERVPSGPSKRWLWAIGALASLLGVGFFVLTSRPARDTRKSEHAAGGDVLAAHGTARIDPGMADSRAASSSNAAAAVKPQFPVPNEPAPNEEAAEEVEAEDQVKLETEHHDELDAEARAALKRADGLVSQASALRKRRKLEPARSKYRAALAVYPDHPRALYGLVQVAIQLHDGKQAVQLATELVQAKPEQVSYLVLLGDAYKAAGQAKDAREAWQSAARKGSAPARKRLR